MKTNFICPVDGCQINGLKNSDLGPHWKNECKYIYLTCKKCKQETERNLVIDHNCVESLLYTLKKLKFENKNLHQRLEETEKQVISDKPAQILTKQ